MIRQKKKICVSCGTETYIFSKGRCKFCAQKEYNKPKKEKVDNSDFFAEFQKTATPICRENNKPIYNLSKLNFCHIFPKRKYKSVAHNSDNIIIYSWAKHTLFDDYLDKMDIEGFIQAFPNSKDEVISKVKKLLPILKEHGNLRNKFEEFLAQENN